MAIPRFKNENRGSLLLIEYIPFYGIEKFVPAATSVASAGLTLKPGYSWQKITCSEDTMGHQQDQTNSDEGESFSQQVIGFVTGDEIDIEYGLIDLKQKRFIVRITLTNGVRKIVGNPTEPLTFKAKSNTTELISGRPGTQITFSGDTLTRALFYTE